MQVCPGARHEQLIWPSSAVLPMNTDPQSTSAQTSWAHSSTEQQTLVDVRTALPAEDMEYSTLICAAATGKLAAATADTSNKPPRCWCRDPLLMRLLREDL
eukprot:CAMPEP_0178443942 /NCGR_PEP_ID=MMETSP0689_2-20121128/39202_1 /TAXON_ID=160604 /ORGANISM="Amphidinium massartii, Strain CS-259" /LENGTH=100 /DNA_ID=CAMNT_0020068059 /DNA_START=708 /DNA_END=1007 /DNA_ORIENTATION=+